MIYQPLTDGSGSTVVEAVVSGWLTIKEKKLTDSYFQAEYTQQYYLQQYRQKRNLELADLDIVEIQKAHRITATIWGQIQFSHTHSCQRRTLRFANCPSVWQFPSVV